MRRRFPFSSCLLVLALAVSGLLCHAEDVVLLQFEKKGALLPPVAIALYEADAPRHVANFRRLVASGFYKDTLFHRVISGFVVQGGGYTTGMVKRTAISGPIELESNKGLSNLRGTLAMARTNVPNSATSEFFVNLVDNLALDYKNAANPGYAVFGTVVQGLEVVDAIAAQATGVRFGFADVPLEDITITLAVQSR
jgi:cyclophilin family peptidyl-prolyl cis-trans isomerase